MTRAGLIIGIVLGIAFLVISVIVALVVVQNVADIHEPLEVATGNGVVSNETGGWVNATGYNLAKYDEYGFTNPVITKLYNATDDLELDIGNASVTDAGLITNSTHGLPLNDAIISYTYNFKEATTSVEQITSNFTTGITNVSNKIPTVLLIAAVVLVLGILSILWSQYKRMQVGGSTEI